MMKLEWAEFFAKYTVISIAALWALCTGTDYLNKQSAELELKNKRLSRNSIGLVDHTLSLNAQGSLWGTNNDLCTISGKYALKNIGDLPVVFELVKFKVYALPPIQESELNDQGVISKTVSLQVNNLTPIHSESIGQLERVGVGGQLERLYRYTIQIKPAYSYAVVANAVGGLSTPQGTLDSDNMFGEFELQHFNIANLCQ